MKETVLAKIATQDPRRLTTAAMLLVLLLLAAVDPALAQDKCPPEHSSC